MGLILLVRQKGWKSYLSAIYYFCAVRHGSRQPDRVTFDMLENLKIHFITNKF